MRAKKARVHFQMPFYYPWLVLINGHFTMWIGEHINAIRMAIINVIRIVIFHSIEVAFVAYKLLFDDCFSIIDDTRRRHCINLSLLLLRSTSSPLTWGYELYPLKVHHTAQTISHRWRCSGDSYRLSPILLFSSQCDARWW